jgi:hypothetical protein
MEFNELVEKIGLGAAAVILKDRLPKIFWDSLSIEECFYIHACSGSDSDLKIKMRNMAVGRAGTVEECNNICYLTSDAAARKEALEKAMELAGPIDDWIHIYYFASYHIPDPEIKRKTLDKIKELAGTVEECTCNCKYDIDPEAEEELLGRAKELAKTAKDWIVIYNYQRNSEQKQASLDKAIEAAETVKDWVYICDHIGCEPLPVKINTLDNAMKLAKTAKDWAVIMRIESDFSVLDEEISDRILELAETVEECLYICDYSPYSRDSEFKTKSLKKAIGLAKTTQECLDVHDLEFDSNTPNSEIEEMALNRAMELATTAEEYADIHKHRGYNYAIGEKSLEMFKKTIDINTVII